MNIQFYKDGSRIRYSDDDCNPEGITFDSIEPVDTAELEKYLATYDAEFSRLNSICQSGTDDEKNTARGLKNRLNWEQAHKLDAFCKSI